MRLILFLILFLTSCSFNTIIESPEVDYNTQLETAAGPAPNDEVIVVLAKGSAKSKPALKPMPPAAGPSGERRAMMEAASAVAGSAGPTRNLVAPSPISAQLTTASMAFNVKDKANIDDIIKVQLLINPYKSVENLKRELTVAGSTTTATVKVSKIIIASLAAPHFKITKITSEEQALKENETTEWVWKLEPTEVGNHEIEVTITAVIKIDGESTPYHIRTYDQTIKVEITPKQLVDNWFKEHWEWLFSTLLIPVGVWIYTRRKKKKLKTVKPSS